MRKVIVFNSVSLDGYYAGPTGEIHWMIHDPELDKAAHERMSPDTILFGKDTYQMFESYWPHVADNPHAPEGARNMAVELNQMHKVVFSSTLPEAAWVNSVLFHGNLAEEVGKLKSGTGRDITIFGSGSIVRQLAEEGLIDEYLLAVMPVLLGAGRSFYPVYQETGLQLLEHQAFNSGIILLHYSVTTLQPSE